MRILDRLSKLCFNLSNLYRLKDVNQIVSEKGLPVQSNLSSLNWVTLHIDPVYTNKKLDFKQSYASIQFHKIEKGGLSGYKVEGTENYEQMCTDSEGFFLIGNKENIGNIYNLSKYPRRYDNLILLSWGLLQYLALDRRTDCIFAGDYWRYMQDYFTNPQRHLLSKPSVFMPDLWLNLHGDLQDTLVKSFFNSFLEEIKLKNSKKLPKDTYDGKTKPGYVYFLQNSFTLDVKIGRTGNKDVQKRLKDLQVGSSHPLVVLKVLRCEDPNAKEKEFHSLFSHLRLSGEWFKFEGELKHYLSNSQKRELNK